MINTLQVQYKFIYMHKTIAVNMVNNNYIHQYIKIRYISFFEDKKRLVE